MGAQVKTLVAIPAYNCAKQISRVIGGFDNKLLARVDQVMVIDNGSTDDTVAVAKEAAQKLGSDKIVVCQNKENYGLGGSHKVAFLKGEAMGADYVAILHGDDQAVTQELNNLLDVAEREPELGAILGCRFMSGSTLTGYSWQRIWGNRAINVAFSIMALRPSKDLGSGLNLFKLKDLTDHRYLKFGNNITFNVDLLLDYYRKNTLIKFVPITWREEDQVSNARNFKVGKTALTKLFRWRFGQEDWLTSQGDRINYESNPVT